MGIYKWILYFNLANKWLNKSAANIAAKFAQVELRSRLKKSMTA